jgi:hypothetical protein
MAAWPISLYYPLVEEGVMSATYLNSAEHLERKVFCFIDTVARCNRMSYLLWLQSRLPFQQYVM